MNLKAIVSRLANFAKNNEERAFDILGARPGPGVDLLIRPEEPLCGKWYVIGKTQCGVAFINKFWAFQPLSNQRLAEMRKQAHAWGLVWYTEYSPISISSLENSREIP